MLNCSTFRDTEAAHFDIPIDTYIHLANRPGIHESRWITQLTFVLKHSQTSQREIPALPREALFTRTQRTQHARAPSQRKLAYGTNLPIAFATVQTQPTSTRARQFTVPRRISNRISSDITILHPLAGCRSSRGAGQPPPPHSPGHVTRPGRRGSSHVLFLGGGSQAISRSESVEPRDDDRLALSRGSFTVWSQRPVGIVQVRRRLTTVRG